MEEIYPYIAFRCIDYKVSVAVKPGNKGPLVENIGFISNHITHISITITFDSAIINVVFRADGIGIIKEESWYEFFEHDLDLEKVRRDCRNDRKEINDNLHDYFRSEIGRMREDPFLRSIDRRS